MGFIWNMIQADKNNERADRINIKAFEKIQNAREKQEEQENRTKMALEKLANRKKGILCTTMKNFIEIYEKIMKIDFTEGEGIKELSLSTLTPTIFNDVKNMSATAIGVQMTTGQTIATYLIKGGISGIIAKEAEMNVSVASMRRRQSNVIESQVETTCIALDGIIQRADRISDILAKLNLLFRKSIKTTDEIIEAKGKNRLNYTKSDKECLMTCINIAGAIKKILDIKLLDENGEITKKSLEAIQIGDDYLNQINDVINS